MSTAEEPPSRAAPPPQEVGGVRAWAEVDGKTVFHWGLDQGPCPPEQPRHPPARGRIPPPAGPTPATRRAPGWGADGDAAAAKVSDAVALLKAQSNSFLTEYMREQNIKPEEIDVLEEVLSDSDEAVPESEPKRRKNG